MKPSQLKERTKKFAVAVIQLVEALPKTPRGETLGTPLIRCGTAVGSTYRSACLSRNAYDFAARIGIVEDAVDEACYWFELIEETGTLPAERVRPLLEEGKTLKRIFTKSRKAAAKRQREQIRDMEEMGEEEPPF